MPFCQSCYNPMPPDQEGRNPHKRDCPNQSPEQMLAVIKTQMTEFVWRSNLFVKTHHTAEFWQAKFHTLRLENNGLRRQLRKQAAPAPGPEPDISAVHFPGPQWHNPERIKMSLYEVGEGWRFLRADEMTIPPDGQIFLRKRGVWADSCLQGLERDLGSSYRTRTPLPK